MQISYNWLRDFIDINLSPDEISHTLTMIGLEVEEVQQTGGIPGNLEGVVVGHVITKSQHPDADRLSVCTVDVGQETPLQIVCGASNVAAGQKVPVALVGTTLYPTTGDPIKLKKGKIRGVESLGMICAEDELGIGTSHEGILVLDTEAPVGTPLNQVVKLDNDYIFSIGLTPNRTDAMSHYGVARDLAASLNLIVNQFSLPNKLNHNTNPIPIQVEAADRCGRYAGCVIRGVKVADSPDWLKRRLEAIGQRPINNVVDVTNYVLHGIGQPLHAFDLAQVPGQQIKVKLANEGDKLVTLDGKTRELNPDDLLIAGANGEPLCLAGVMGGEGSGTTTNTTDIFLESAWFEATSVRRVGRRHGLHTDSSFRFERGTDPQMVIPALDMAANLIQSIAGGSVSEFIDILNDDVTPLPVEFKLDQALALIGEPLSREQVTAILKRLDIEVQWVEGSTVATAWVPRYRVDVRRTADLAEEILRIYGFNNVLSATKLVATPDIEDDASGYGLQQLVSDRLAGMGLNEIVTNSLISKQWQQDDSVPMLNPISEEHAFLRTSMLHTGLECIAHNLHRQQPNCRFFDFGKTYRLTAKGYDERQELALFLAGQGWPSNWHQRATSVSLYQLRAVVESLAGWLGLADKVRFAPLEAPSDELGYGLLVLIDKRQVGAIGRVKTSLSKQFDIKSEVFYANLDWQSLRTYGAQARPQYTAIPRFPSVTRDLSLEVEPGMKWAEMEALIKRANPKQIQTVNVFDVFDLGEGRYAYGVSITMQDADKTLEDNDVDKTVQRVLGNLTQTEKVKLRQ